MKEKNIFNKRSVLKKPERFPIVVSHCLWAAYLFAAEHASEEDREDMAKVQESLEDTFLDYPEDHNL